MFSKNTTFRRVRIHPATKHSREFQLMEDLLFNVTFEQVDTMNSLLSMVEDVLREEKVTSFPHPPNDYVEFSEDTGNYLIDFLERNRDAMLSESIDVLEQCIAYHAHLLRIFSIEFGVREKPEPTELSDNRDTAVGTPEFKSPTIEFILQLLLNIDESNENSPGTRASLAALIEHIFTELKVLINHRGNREKSDIDKIKNHIEEFLHCYKLTIEKKNLDALQVCITMLDYVGRDTKNLGAPMREGIRDFNTLTILVGPRGMDLRSRVQRKLNVPHVKCPACNEIFSKFDRDVIRRVSTIKCPSCAQSIIW